MKIIDLFQSKLEIFRLEQRYTKRRNRRSTFVSEAVYVDGEYIYATPPGSPSSSSAASKTSGRSSPGLSPVDDVADSFVAASPSSRPKFPRRGSWRSSRWGSSDKKMDAPSMATMHEARWEDEKPRA